MLEKPDMPDARLIACLRDYYGMRVGEIAFLPLGADQNTAVYRVLADGGTALFLKLRSGPFDAATVAIPRLLRERGVKQVIAPIETRTGEVWARLDDFAVILSPFIEGADGFERDLSDGQWVELGIALKGLHTAAVPPALGASIPREVYSPRLRDLTTMFLARAADTAYTEPVAVQVAALLREQRATITDVVARAGRYADALRARPLPYVLCHADIHAGNVMLTADDRLYVVDWDTPIYAPKEQDLMFIGAGIGGGWRSPREAALFYRGYGEADVDSLVLAYYRFERIVQDVATFCEQLLLTDEGGADRPQFLRYLMSSFEPEGTIAVAYRAHAGI